MQLVFAFIGLLGFPLGTLISILILLHFFSDRVTILFSGKIPDQLTDVEMADLRSIGTAIEEYSIDNSFHPSAASFEELEKHLTPTYIRALPDRDGWNNPFIVQSSPGEYVLLSAGKDGAFDSTEPVGPTNTFTVDIVFSKGSFVQCPEGSQH